MAVIEALTEEECYLVAILQDTSGLDLAEWSLYDPEREDGCWRAWAFQWPWFRCTDPKQLDQCARSVGKALDVETLIPTPTGWTRMGDLAVGDEVLGPDGKPTRVAEAFDVQEGRPCFEVVFDDGSEIVADAEHLWAVEIEGEKVVRTTEEVRRVVEAGGDPWVDATEPLDLPEVDLPIPPYVFGYWLGSGNIRDAGIWVGKHLQAVTGILEDEGVELRQWVSHPSAYGVRYIGEWVELPAGEDVSPRSRLSPGSIRDLRAKAHAGTSASVLAAQFGIRRSAVARLMTGESCREAGGWIRSPRRPLGEALKQLGVLRNKHIPTIFLRASRDQRIALLQGLMDSDGNLDTEGGCEIRRDSYQAAREVFTLLASLGERPHLEASGTSWRVGFGPYRTNPFRIPAKAYPLDPSSGRVPRRRIAEVVPAASRPVRCIAVDNESSLFLAGDSMIPTHNSQSIALRAYAFPFLFPGQEMIVTAPEKVHLDAITDKIETQLLATRLTRELLAGGGRGSIKHTPFHCNFTNGSRIMGRIPQKDGKGIKGIHPIWLEMDEAQDYPAPGWTELVETLKRGQPGAVWRAHGVTRGVRDEFYRFSQPDSDWTVHRHTAMSRPTWTGEERDEKIKQYGSKDHPDYRRNVLGLHGDATNPLFVLHRLMARVDQDETSDYNLDEYFNVRISDEYLREMGGDIISLLDFPAIHLGDQYLFHWVGMDVGYTQAPSEILVFGESRPVKPAKSCLKLLSRIHLERVGHKAQVRAILWVIDYYHPRTFAMDSTGVGLPLYQDLQDQSVAAAQTIRGYNFSSKILVGFDQAIDVDEFTGDPVKEAGIERNVQEYAQDCLRDYVDNGRLWLPWDRNLIGQFQGGTYQTRVGHDQYGRRRVLSQGEDHALDAARMAVLGHTQYHIEQLVKKERQEPVFDTFMY